MEIKEAIILAGGLGTRLRSVLPDTPKCMAPVNGQPFLRYLIDYYQQQGITRFIFALGYKHEVISSWLKQQYPTLKIDCVIEKDPLGTGGAIQLAMEKAKESNVLILNGDTLCKADVATMAAFHKRNGAACTLLLKPMKDFDRYGVVETEPDGHIKSFQEKKQYAQGLINAGVYLLSTGRFRQQKRPAAFSFEKDYLEVFYSALPIYGCVQDTYFIDIGIPEDYERAQKELAAS
ncbi:MAG TPA: nucleotidyltransferase family protein [Chitinophagaceae bacterium]|jgi:D-glycero-alpha-D-manno-heptose 1-phosphate guanylyltransferase|nr:nucleotidyltransferase family protein [Chitinophagaceae bacterium]